MPKNKKQGIIFGILMSYSMAYGMEIYNTAIKHGVNLSAGGLSNMTYTIFWEACFMPVPPNGFTFIIP